MIQKHDHFALNNFEGPLDFLLYLIQKDEMEICDIPIQELTQQFLQKLSEWQAHYLERGAEFVGTVAYLVWLKSKMLLPQQDVVSEGEELEEDPHFEIIHHLIDYCRFKQAAKELAVRQEQQQACYFRGASPVEWKKPMGIDHVSLAELASLFKDMMSRASQAKGFIQEENWRVSDKIRLIRQLLEQQEIWPFEALFTLERPRLEMIVTFLAVLELMKMGLIGVGKHLDSSQLVLFAKQQGSA
ncbi:segregation and condensation protein A [Candidatus Protochlamydia phocaeensis]|uniref:segregation and condensation protein A n=1 Tax=Candidatus Protochlamydia phocaeensis TaxID=1414722 RepID=UPI000837D981|nr:segregation/condensation protein A [Candidatus Protochlamydia phocaeensis]